MSTPLSILDLAPISSGGTHASALADTLAVGRLADELGYSRIWVAEHHGMPSIASSAPAVLIGALADATTRIRVGSGGVMLPNHSSLVVAEQFGTLVALHGDRIDLGLGRAAGTEPLVTAAIRRGLQESVDDFPNQVLELLAYFGEIPALEGGQGDRIRAIPGLGDAPQVWLLGSSDFSARLAGMMGLPFAFAHHFAGGGSGGRSAGGGSGGRSAGGGSGGRSAGGGSGGRSAGGGSGGRSAGGDATDVVFDLYRRAFTPSVLLEAPRSAVAVSTLVAPTASEARRRALPQALTMLSMRQGRLLPRVPSVEEAEAHPWTEAETAWVDERHRPQAIGDAAHVRARIDDLVARTGADEVVLAVQGATLEHRLETVRALAPAPESAPRQRASVGG